MDQTTARENKEFVKELAEAVSCSVIECEMNFNNLRDLNYPEIEVNENGMEFTLVLSNRIDEEDLTADDINNGYERITYHVKLPVTGTKEHCEYDVEYENDYPTHGDYQNLREE